MLFTTRKLAVFAALLVLLRLAAACSGGDDGGTGSPATTEPVVHTPIDSEVLPIVISSDLAVGENRFMVGLINQSDDSQVLGADVHFRFFVLQGDTGTLKFESDAQPVRITKTYTHTHPDGTVETHEAGETGAYVANVEFDSAGTWGVEVTGTTESGDELEPLRPSFSVSETPFGLAAGDPAPLSVQPLVTDVADIRDIDTSQEPIPEQHSMTIADAVQSGKPTVVAFASPAYCQTQICGPTKEIFDDAYQQYKDRVNFIHIEPYDVPKMRENACQTLADCLNPVLSEWRLESEPWIFVVDARGKISASFDSIVSLEELEAEIDATLGG